MKHITPQELQHKTTENSFVIDIREPFERAESALPSHHIPMGDICDRIAEIPRDKEVILVCQSGRRAEAVANLLETEYQFTHVSILLGGMQAYTEINH